jgi:type I restriction enzyme S subunit
MIFNNSKFNSHWPTKALNELGTFNRGKSKHRPRNDIKLFMNGNIPLIQTGNVKQANIFIKTHSNNYNQFGLAQSKLWAKGTLCITIAANIAETSMLDYDMCFPDSIVGFNAFPDECSETFMHYIFTYIRAGIQSRIQGSIQDNINIEYLTNLKFKIPVKEERKQIENLLFSLDAKIEINNKINQELEAMAKTLYDYWFVQFDFPDKNGKPYKSSGGNMVFNEELKREIPEGWEDGTFETISTITGGSTPSKAVIENFTKENNISWITPKDLSQNKGKKFITRGEWDVSNLGIKNASLKIMPKGTVLLSSRAPIGYLAISRQEVTTNQGFKSFVLKENYSSEFIYYSVKNQIPKIEAYSSGSTFKEVSSSTLKTIKISIPNQGVLKEYYTISKPIFKKQNLLELENQKLSELRDWLLPMLMNGQVTVGSLEKEVEGLGLVAEGRIEYKQK